MPNNWTKCKLGDVVDKASTGLDAIRRAPIVPNNTGIKCLRIQDVSQNKPISNWGYCNVSTNDYNKFKLLKEDILIARTGASVGVNMLVEEDIPSVFNNGLIRIKCSKKTISKYIHYSLQSDYFKNHIYGIAFGTVAQPNIQIRDLLGFKINLPPLDEQKRIAGVLGAFDDKIELLQKQNKTLEDMAKAIFKSWFVDFDIVKAKQRGEDKQKILSTYKITEELYNLFPSSFTDAPASSSLGPIPTGWEVKQIKDICKMDRGLSYKSENLVPSDTALVTLKSFNRGGGYRLDGLKSYYGKYKAEQEVALKDIVVACTDVTQNAEVVGKPAIVLSKYPFKKLLASCDLVILRPYEENKRAFIWQLLMSEYYQKYILAFVSGTTVLHLNKEGINIYQFPFSSEVASYFSSLVNTYIDKIISNYNQIQTLTELRDGLLPRLLSGKIRV